MLLIHAALSAVLFALPQDPPTTDAPVATPEVATQPAPATPSQADLAMAAATLRRAETSQPNDESAIELAQLVRSGDAKIAARAAWLLGEWKSTHGIDALTETLQNSNDADLRLQAAAALDRMPDARCGEALTRAAHDADMSVRAFAAQALARRKQADTSKHLLALLEREGSKEAKNGEKKDVAAALIALADLGDANDILPAASVVRFSTKETSEALVFLFQELSPKLSPEAEAKTLVATLDHADPLLRRYAIQRLGELRDPTTARALEGRLAVEDPALQPLLRVSLAQTRRDKVENGADLALRAKQNAIAIGKLVERQWNSLETGTRLSAAAVTCVVAFGMLLILVARRRAHRAEAARQALTTVTPASAMLRTGRPEFRATPRFQQPSEAGEPVGSGRY